MAWDSSRVIPVRPARDSGCSACRSGPLWWGRPFKSNRRWAAAPPFSCEWQPPRPPPTLMTVSKAETAVPLRILLADDHVTVRHGLKLLIDSQPDMKVVSE